MTYAIGIGICAILFVVFGIFRPARQCGGNCGVCTHACDTSEAEHAHD